MQVEVRLSDASNGENGGSGGNGGSGSSGAPGGSGGQIVLRVSEYDTHLLLLVSHDVEAASGGKAGANGRGGKGGGGGLGGDGHSWSVTRTERDWLGHERIRHEHHSKPGGYNGRDGHDGSDATTLLYDGPQGQRGTFTIAVVERDGIHHYADRYDLKLVGFRHRNENGDGIYEPEETIYVTDVEVQNTGKMPTPAHHDIVIAIVETDWIAPAEATLVVPRSLAPGERHLFRGLELPFKLRVFNPQRAGAALKKAETIRLQASLPRVRSVFEGFAVTEEAMQMGRIAVRFPLEITPLTSLFSLAPGEAARLQWNVMNVSERAVGFETDEPRAVSVNIVMAGGDLQPNQIHLFDERGTHVPLDRGFARSVARIDAKHGNPFELTVAVSEDAPPHASARLVLAVQLGHFDAPNKLRPIQFQEFVVRVGEATEARQADVLVVANNRSDKTEIEAWREVIASFGLSSAVFDVSHVGNLEILRDVANGERKFRMVVLLDNSMDTGQGPRPPTSLLDPTTTLALTRAGVHVLQIHSGTGSILDRTLVPIDPVTPTERRAIDGTDREAVAAACANEPIGGNGVLVALQGKSDIVALRSKWLSEFIEARWPERRFVVWTTGNGDTDTRDVERLHRLMIRRTADAARGSLTALNADEHLVHDARFVREARTRSLFADALPFEIATLLLSLTPLPFGGGRAQIPGGVEDALVASVLTRLAVEMANVRHFGWGTSREKVVSAMPLLAYVEQYAFSTAPPHDDADLKRFGKPSTTLDPQSHRGRRLVELCAWLEILAGGQVRFWEWIPPFLWLRRGRKIRSRVREAIATLVGRVAPTLDDQNAVHQAIAARVKEIKESWLDLERRREASSNGAEFTQQRLAARFADYDVDFDAAHLAHDARRFSAAEAAQRQTERTRVTLDAEGAVQSASTRRDALFVPTSCSELLARAAPPMRIAVEEPPASAEASVGEIEVVFESDERAPRREALPQPR
ncbi:PE_PGRS [Labilithrix luteola]|uniref:PE_PGRS n=1 Tax=Labilithrix luteola TaxID=1391654 RepID=A0A0K1Q239_9BACT|nr:PE_PGRS [Labilithrix luteola]